jgi:hypothetical protein
LRRSPYEILASPLKTVRPNYTVDEPDNCTTCGCRLSRYRHLGDHACSPCARAERARSAAVVVVQPPPARAALTMAEIDRWLADDDQRTAQIGDESG